MQQYFIQPTVVGVVPKTMCLPHRPDCPVVIWISNGTISGEKPHFFIFRPCNPRGVHWFWTAPLEGSFFVMTDHRPTYWQSLKSAESVRDDPKSVTFIVSPNASAQVQQMFLPMFGATQCPSDQRFRPFNGQCWTGTYRSTLKNYFRFFCFVPDSPAWKT